MYVFQKLNGIPVANSVASIATDKFGNALTISNAWVKISSAERKSLSHLKRQALLSASQAVASFAKVLGVEVNSQGMKESVSADGNTVEVTGAGVAIPGVITCKKTSYKTSKEVVPTWSVQIEFKLHWYNAFVSMKDGSLVATNDFMSSDTIDDEEDSVDALAPSMESQRIVKLRSRQEAPQANGPQTVSYDIFPVNPSNRPKTILNSLADSNASPFGWHSNSQITTMGNNLDVHRKFSQGVFFETVLKV